MSDRPYLKHHVAVCGGQLALGTLMSHLSHFLAGANGPKGQGPARFVDKTGVEREGIAQTWDKWEDELGISRKRFRNILEKLDNRGYDYLVRASRTCRWGGIRLHLAITDVYVRKLTRCVALGPKAYREATKTSAHQHAAAGTQVGAKALTQGQDQIAPLGNSSLAQEGNSKLPTEGNSIEDSSHTHSETLHGTAIPAIAEDAQHGGTPLSSPGEEKSMTLSPHTPPSPAKPVEGAAVEVGAIISTATSQGLATTLRDLGLLAEWQRACAEIKCFITEVPTDEQRDALGWWARYMPEDWGQRPEDRVAALVGGWNEYVSRFDVEDVRALNLHQPPEKPSLEFVWHVVEGLKAAQAGKSASPPN